MKRDLINRIVICIVLSTFMISCKKNNVINDVKLPNDTIQLDTNYYYVALNKNISATHYDSTSLLVGYNNSDSLDLDNDHIADVSVLVVSYTSGSIKQSYVVFTYNPSHPDIRFLTYKSADMILGPSYINLTKTLPFATIIDSSSTIWNATGFVSYSLEMGIINYDYSLSGKGDQYIGIMLLLPDGKHYGWMKINVSANNKTIIVREYAYHKRPGAPVSAGTK